MMIFNIITNVFLNKIFILAIDVIAVFLAFIVFKDNPKGKLNRIYLWMTVLMMCWVNFAYIPRFIGLEYYNLGLISLKIAWFVTSLFFIFIYLLTVNLVGKEEKYKKLTWGVILIGILLSILAGFTNLVISGFGVIGGVTTIVYGDYKIPFLIGVTLMTIAIIMPLISRKNILQDKRMQYFFIGLCIFIVLNVIFNIILPMFFGISQWYFLGDYSTLILLTFIAYAIVKHSLFGIKIIATQFAVVLFVLLLLLNFFSSISAEQYIWNAILLILSLFIGYLVIKNTLKELRIHKEFAKKTGEIIKKMEDIVNE